MNIIVDGLPYTVEVGGMEYQINTGFRTSILFEMMMLDDGLSDTEKVIKAVQLYYPETPGADLLPEAVDKVIWFYSCGDPPKEKTKIRRDDDEDEDETGDLLGSRNRGKMVYSFEYDAPYIYAAFLEQYGIDLVETDDCDLHWWKFKALFQSLNEKTQFMKIMGYRGVKITSKMSKEQKDYYRRMQKMYALPLPQEEVDRQNAIIEALKNGGDVSHLL